MKLFFYIKIKSCNTYALMQLYCIQMLLMQFVVLFLGVYGALAAPHAPHVSHDPHLDNNAEIVDGQLPGTENLNEKVLPISRLFATRTNNLPARNNLAEKSQVPQQLPGTANLAEKRIPDIVLKRLSQVHQIKEKKITV